MDAANTLLTVILIFVALLLVGVGVYLIIVLHEAHKSLQRANKVLDRTESIMGFLEDKVIRPASNFGSFASLLREGLIFFYDLKKTVAQDKKKETKDE